MRRTLVDGSIPGGESLLARSLLSALVGVTSAETLPAAMDLTSLNVVALKGSPFLDSTSVCVCVFRFYCLLFSPSVSHFV